MRRSAELEGVDYEAELVFGLFLAYAEHLEHALLHGRLVDTDGSAAEFGAVKHEVVGICADALEVFFLVGIEPVQVLRFGGGEGVMHRIEAAVLLAPFEQREVHDPEGSEHVRIAEPETVAHLHAQYAELGLGLALLATEHQHQVADTGTHGGCDAAKILLGEELVYGRFHRSVRV